MFSVVKSQPRELLINCCSFDAREKSKRMPVEGGKTKKIFTPPTLSRTAGETSGWPKLYFRCGYTSSKLIFLHVVTVFIETPDEAANGPVLLKTRKPTQIKFRYYRAPSDTFAIFKAQSHLKSLALRFMYSWAAGDRKL
ncbi:hypothetical protein V9T40_011994 [Parthenolecanium corni]|uniref:Uncharacterized protein n=1 Tax=Parthenolecanium corni TaxID=536013 RepID=A0AAN9TAB8_9HEMI